MYNYSMKSKIRLNENRQPKSAAHRLLYWYDANRRILPWRALSGETPDPYRVWLSEIMLQQTTVGAVGPYFQKFVKLWPTVQDLASASLDDVLRQWAGLGYYRRARALHECAQKIIKYYNGIFPDSESELLELPGFGPYTTAALLSIAFDQRANVVDGNVERVMARIFAIDTPLPKSKQKLKRVAETLLPKSRYGDYAQALMDLGATICTPRNAKCDLCPWRKSCRAHFLGIVEKLPRRIKARPKPIRRAMAFVLINERNEILLRKRPPKGLLGGMMEVPSSEWSDGTMPTLELAVKKAPAKANWQMADGMVRHTFSHFELEIKVAVGKVQKSKVKVRGVWIPFGRLKDEALPSVMQKITRLGLREL